MNKILYRTLLLDFYGELLTERQKAAYELHFLDDLSLNEVAESLGVTRQAVWDIVTRTEKLMESYDEKLGLLEKHAESQRLIEEIGVLLERIDDRETAAEINVRLKALAGKEE